MDTLVAVPNQPKTPIRGTRISDETWAKFQEIAAERNEIPSEIIRAAVVAYVAEHDATKGDNA